MESKLCVNCFAALEPGSDLCPACGWDNSAPQTPQALEFHTVVAPRHQVGRVKAANGEGFTYAALDLNTNKAVELRRVMEETITAIDKAVAAI